MEIILLYTKNILLRGLVKQLIDDSRYKLYSEEEMSEIKTHVSEFAPKLVIFDYSKFNLIDFEIDFIESLKSPILVLGSNELDLKFSNCSDEITNPIPYAELNELLEKYMS